ncbi:nociceptin receptor isoform X1 [Peromyscus californicus insignis]|uniref:nociceptin receptor isoform X1 n=1 Tax=Peromyscus californicus insignis TaxID=564181 RepID=UPI0022A67A81|nr:nociceptin receptor isoform X1 [Peromyscus californicus insignis]
MRLYPTTCCSMLATAPSCPLDSRSPSWGSTWLCASGGCWGTASSCMSSSGGRINLDVQLLFCPHVFQTRCHHLEAWSSGRALRGTGDSRHTKMKTATNIYIFNLALADTLVLLTLPFQGTDILLGFWPFGNALCKTVIAIDYYNMFTSTFTLTAMSVDRYVAICHPIRALDVRTSSKAQAVNVAIWALASVVGVPVAIMGSAQVEDEEIECLVEIPAPQDYWGPVFAICIFLFSFIIPVLIISVCYSLMIRRLRGVRLLSGSREKDRNLRRITRLVLVVVAVFVGCWTPVQVFVLVQGLGVQPGSEAAVAILRFCTALGYVNSCLNPILYAFLDENFKACFRKFCCASALHREVQVSDRVRSIAKDVGLACKTSQTVPRPA